MKIYLVGGAVRDKLMGLTPKDLDYVVVGSSPSEMIELGYQQVGAGFPVFLKNGEEYALARTERKVAAGYNGFETVFDPTVTLADDLVRRDLTINSMAMDLTTGELIDPYHGREDLHRGILRHTSEAFAEDPVRVLRTARFAARYDFEIAPGTIELMQEVAPELEFVPQERIFAEFQKGLMENSPWRMLEVLRLCDVFDVDCMSSYGRADYTRLSLVQPTDPFHARFALVATAFNGEDFESYKIPSHLATLTKAFRQNFENFDNYHSVSSATRIELFETIRAFSNPTLLEQCLDILRVHKRWSAKGNIDIEAYLNQFWIDLECAKSIDAASIAASCSCTQEIKHAITRARVQALVDKS